MVAIARAFKACIFDFDGVIIDSEPVHTKAARRTLQHFGIAYPESIFQDFIGLQDAVFFGAVIERLGAGSAASIEDLLLHTRLAYAELLPEVRLTDGVARFVATAQARFGKLGLATSASKDEVAAICGKFGLRDWFDAIVDGEDTLHHKPDPEPYLRVLAALGTAGPDALAIEDSPAGIRSARGAGCITAGLTTSFPPAQLHAAGADLVVGSFAELAGALGLPAAAASPAGFS